MTYAHVRIAFMSVCPFAPKSCFTFQSRFYHLFNVWCRQSGRHVTQEKGSSRANIQGFATRTLEERDKFILAANNWKNSIFRYFKKWWIKISRPNINGTIDKLRDADVNGSENKWLIRKGRGPLGYSRYSSGQIRACLHGLKIFFFFCSSVFLGINFKVMNL